MKKDYGCTFIGVVIGLLIAVVLYLAYVLGQEQILSLYGLFSTFVIGPITP